MVEVISFTNAQITQLSHLFGDEIMTGSEISRVLTRVGIQDNSGASTKWRRLEYAFTERQNCDRAGNAILRFVQEVLAPVNYVQNQDTFEDRRSRLNGILSFSGIQYRADGQFERRTVAKTNVRHNEVNQFLAEKLAALFADSVRWLLKNGYITLEFLNEVYPILDTCKEENLRGIHEMGLALLRDGLALLPTEEGGYCSIQNAMLP